ncbi:hypothetical protein [Nonomuraea diastatica]|uniref:DUF4352 domain-containing protein n=1 Tax=Nonomuraea diastatica TaxID=1848329 RepID=A0A4R4X1J9_9ACTN|nr:hypothetical protein [Nonomuraea diastatica]TDD23995.1 hypothetical protein E1294_07005 [Nonomuraea diastatica]
MRLTKVLTLVTAAVLAAGCQLGQPSSPQSTEEDAPSRSEPVKRASTAVTVPPDRVLAGREGTFDGHTFKVEIVQLIRRERFVNLTFTATVTKDGGGLGWQVHNSFSAVPKQNPTVDGVYLVDVRNAKKHLVALDSEGGCVCSRIEALFLKQDQSAVFSATFAAPPADVGSVDVHIPNVGTLANVPIS